MKYKIELITIFLICVLAFLSCESLNDNEENKGVEPLLQTKWDHHVSPFNDLLPMDGVNRSVGGCVAGATAQIMRFHKHPERGIGQSEAYITSTRKFNIPSVDFNVVYEWDNMLYTYPNASSSNEQQRNAVAILHYHIAVGMNTDFTSDGSSQGGAIAPLTNHFNYDRSVESLLRSFFDNDAEWEAILKSQLDAGLPVLYGGRNSQGGGSHFFVVDGYDNNGKFHINMGYGGRADGLYFLNDIKYGGQDHSYQQSMDINIKPNKGAAGTERMALIIFSPEKTSASRNEIFNVTIQMRGVGYFSGGRAGIALVDNNNNIVAVIGERNNPERRPGGITGEWNIECTVPNYVDTKQYKLRVVIKPTNSDWRIVTLSTIGDGVPSSFDFLVK